MHHFSTKDPGFWFGDRVFIAIVRLAEKEQDVEFLTGPELVELGDYLGVNSNACLLVSEKYRRRFKMSVNTNVLICVVCKRPVKVSKYRGPEPYRCAKCRGIEIPKKSKVQVENNH